MESFLILSLVSDCLVASYKLHIAFLAFTIIEKVSILPSIVVTVLLSRKACEYENHVMFGRI